MVHHHVQTNAEPGQILTPRQKAPLGLGATHRYNFSKIVSAVPYSYAEFHRVAFKDAKKALR